MRKLIASRPGLSLVEQVVALGAAAVVAAVVFPTVIGQLDKAEVGRIQEDLLAVEKATKTFRLDIGNAPKDILQLVVPIAAGDEDLAGQPYVSALAVKWSGPYFEPKRLETQGTGETAVQALFTAAGAHFLAEKDFTTALWGPTSAETYLYIALELEYVSFEDAQRLSAVIDGEELLGGFTLGTPEGDPSLASTAGGRVRWIKPAGDTCTVVDDVATGKSEGCEGKKGTLVYFAGPLT